MAKDNSHLLRKPKLPLGWVRNMIEGVHSQKEWQDIVKGLPDQVKVQFLLATQPKEIKADVSSTFRLIIEGLQSKAIQGQVIEQAALEGHEDEDGVNDNAKDII